MTTVEHLRRTPQERQAWAVFIGLHVSFLVFLFVQATTQFQPQWTWWGMLSLVASACQIHHSRAAARGERATAWPLTFSLLIVIAVMLYITTGFGGGNTHPMLVAASAAMLLPGRYPVLWILPPAFASLAAGVLSSLIDGDPSFHEWFWWYVIYNVTIYMLGAGGLAISAHLVYQVGRLQRTRIELAESAVARERLRVARDLHDLLGQSLSAVVLKGELAMRLQATDPERARREVEDLATIAGTTLADLRAVTRDHRDTGLAEEAAGAARLLDAAGVRSEVHVDVGILPAAVDRLLGWTLREGITNVLRHSDASWCTIRAERGDTSVLLEIVNDRPAAGGERGTGLAGLDARSRELGGKLSTVHGGDQFLLRLDVPLEAL